MKMSLPLLLPACFHLVAYLVGTTLLFFFIMWYSATDVAGQCFSCTRENEKNTRLFAAYKPPLLPHTKFVVPALDN